jgi:hypothetical protein
MQASGCREVLEDPQITLQPVEHGAGGAAELPADMTWHRVALEGRSMPACFNTAGRSRRSGNVFCNVRSSGSIWDDLASMHGSPRFRSTSSALPVERALLLLAKRTWAKSQ